MIHRDTRTRRLAALPLRLMTFNLRRRKPSDGPNTWSERRGAAAEVVRRYAPDVVGTQEGLDDQILDMLHALPAYGYLGQARMGGRDDEFNAVFYRKDRFVLLESGDFWLSDTPDVPGSRHWGNYVPRMATWARFRDRATGEPFYVYNSHFDHLVPGARRKAAELVTRRFPDSRENVVLMGDLNAVPHGGTYRWLTRHRRGPRFHDSLALAEAWAPQRWNATFHKFTGRGLYRIDYLLFKHPARVRRHVVVRDTPGGKFPSDHFPVFADVELPLAAS